MDDPLTIKLPVDCCDEEETVEPATEPVHETLHWNVETLVEKYDGDYTGEEIMRLGIKPVEVVHDQGNMVTNAGIQRLLDQLIGATTSPFDATHARLGVGNSGTATTAGMTDLVASSGSSNRQFKVMDTSLAYPLRSSQTVTFKSIFASGEAQFAWNEWCIDRGTADGTTVTAPMFNRRVPSGGLGTKGAVSWALTVSITPTSTSP